MNLKRTQEGLDHILKQVRAGGQTNFAELDAILRGPDHTAEDVTDMACGTIFHHRETGLHPKDVCGCRLPEGHSGWHEFKATDGKTYEWIAAPCECENCRRADGSDCVRYRTKSPMEARLDMEAERHSLAATPTAVLTKERIAEIGLALRIPAFENAKFRADSNSQMTGPEQDEFNQQVQFVNTIARELFGAAGALDAALASQCIEVVATRFEAIDRETDHPYCLGCKTPETWGPGLADGSIKHSAGCIVLRARAALTAAEEKKHG